MDRAGHGSNEGIEVAVIDPVNPSGWLTPDKTTSCTADPPGYALVECATAE